MAASRRKANVLITGTPGVGKTVHGKALAKATALEYLSVNDVVAADGCNDGWSAEHGSWMVNDDKLLSALEKRLQRGGLVLDSHMCDIFPEEHIDLVVVLRCETSLLYDRLTERNYSKSKLDENIDAEIMQVILEEANSAFRSDIIIECESRITSDIEENVATIVGRIPE